MQEEKIKITDLPEYIQIMHKEYTDLGEKIQECAKFLESDEGKNLEITRRNLLTTQMSAMITYSNILSLRISTEIGINKDLIKKEKPEVVEPEVVK